MALQTIKIQSQKLSGLQVFSAMKDLVAASPGSVSSCFVALL